MPALPLSLPSFSFLSLSLSLPPAFLSHLICDSTWRPNDSEIFLPNAFCSCLSVVVSILVVFAWLLLLLSISNKFCILNLHCSGYKTGGTDLPLPTHTNKLPIPSHCSCMTQAFAMNFLDWLRALRIALVSGCGLGGGSLARHMDSKVFKRCHRKIFMNQH